MGESETDDSTPIETLECLSECEQTFSKLLKHQALVFKNRRRAKTLTDREVRNAYDTLLEGRAPSVMTVAFTHLLEAIGAGTAAFGWHFGKDHADYGFASWTMIATGLALLCAGIVIRECYARK